MAKLIIIVGLPGSGKSHLIKGLRNSISGVCVEDYMKDSKQDSHRFTESQHYPQLIRDLRHGKDCLIADVAFCDTWRRIEVEQVVKNDVPDLEIEWLFFENNPEKCKANARSRNRNNLKEELKNISELSAKYNIPRGIEIKEILLSDKSNQVLD